MPDRFAVAEKGPNRDLTLDLEHNLVDAYIDRWIDLWATTSTDETRRWLLQYEASGVRLLLHLWILRKQDSKAMISRHHLTLLKIAEDIFELALAHEYIPYFAFKTGYIVFAAEIVLRLGDRPDLVLRMALRMAGNPDRPPIRTSTRANGYQMLAMLS